MERIERFHGRRERKKKSLYVEFLVHRLIPGFTDGDKEGGEGGGGRERGGRRRRHDTVAAVYTSGENEGSTFDVNISPASASTFL